jgi:8-oxo-dGTP pyrophosphatase MutT (NUDIX family)
MPILDKVAAFILRGEGAERELLLFRHPTAGIQLPAGTVEPGETVEAAVLREVQEETGLAQVEIVRKLAVLRMEMPPGECAFWRDVPARAEPRADAPTVPLPSGRGAWVTRTEIRGTYAHVAYEEIDLNATEPIVTLRQTGWVPAEALTDQVDRHLFLLRTTAPTPDRWSVHADAGHAFALYWSPLLVDPGLVAGQDTWWHAMREQ